MEDLDNDWAAGGDTFQPYLAAPVYDGPDAAREAHLVPGGRITRHVTGSVEEYVVLALPYPSHSKLGLKVTLLRAQYAHLYPEGVSADDVDPKHKTDVFLTDMGVITAEDGWNPTNYTTMTSAE